MLRKWRIIGEGISVVTKVYFMIYKKFFVHCVVHLTGILYSQYLREMEISRDKEDDRLTVVVSY
jgi:hypothetical protein